MLNNDPCVDRFGGGLSFYKDAVQVLDDVSVNTIRGTISSANILEFSVGTTGWRGGDYGHGGRTFIRMDFSGSSALKVKATKSDTVEIAVAGDCELDTLTGALDLMSLILSNSREGGTISEEAAFQLAKNASAKAIDMNVRTYLDKPISNCFIHHFASGDGVPKFPFVLDLSGIIISCLYYLGWHPTSDIILPEPGRDSCGIDISFDEKKIRIRCNKGRCCTFALEKPLGTRGSVISELQLEDISYYTDVLDIFSSAISGQR
jgi:hypothetical protein